MTTPISTPMPTPMDFVCPWCAAAVGVPCAMKNSRTAPHGARTVLQIQAAIKWAASNNTEERK
ncbi:zinc finger domain-containing protein [Streptomyces sp. 1222.5]|uniref:zinc finger domain-containing protein n=1 Tax=Streptomyces sp. 1222.5 TaxID=1881026 RepID=UPI003D73E849